MNWPAIFILLGGIIVYLILSGVITELMDDGIIGFLWPLIPFTVPLIILLLLPYFAASIVRRRKRKTLNAHIRFVKAIYAEGRKNE